MHLRKKKIHSDGRILFCTLNLFSPAGFPDLLFHINCDLTPKAEVKFNFNIDSICILMKDANEEDVDGVTKPF